MKTLLLTFILIIYVIYDRYNSHRLLFVNSNSKILDHVDTCNVNELTYINYESDSYFSTNVRRTKFNKFSSSKFSSRFEESHNKTIGIMIDDYVNKTEHPMFYIMIKNHNNYPIIIIRKTNMPTWKSILCFIIRYGEYTISSSGMD